MQDLIVVTYLIKSGDIRAPYDPFAPRTECQEKSEDAFSAAHLNMTCFWVELQTVLFALLLETECSCMVSEQHDFKPSQQINAFSSEDPICHGPYILILN